MRYMIPEYSDPQGTLLQAGGKLEELHQDARVHALPD